MPYPLAGRLIRLVSTGLDFLLYMTLYFGFCGVYMGKDEELLDVCGLVPYVLLIVYEIVFATSPAKQALGLKVHFDFPGFRYRVYRALLKYCLIPFIIYPSMLFTKRHQGLHEKGAKSVVLNPHGKRTWLRAVLATVVGAYGMTTFGCGRFFHHIMADRYDPELVDLQPEPWVPEDFGRTDWNKVWVQRGYLELPRQIQGHPLRATPFVYFYNASRDNKLAGSRVVVMLGSEEHPYREYCKPPKVLLKWAFSCTESPRVAQKAIFETTTENDLFFDPRRLIGENVRRYTKSRLLEGDELLNFRTHVGSEYSVVWHTVANYNDDGELATIGDYFNIGGDENDHHYRIRVIWIGVERQESFVSSLIESFRFDSGNEEIAARFLKTGRSTGSTYDLMNALELAEDKLPTAEALYAIYAREVPGFEHRQFASWISYQVEEGDLRFMDLNEKVWDWRPAEDKKEATEDPS